MLCPRDRLVLDMPANELGIEVAAKSNQLSRPRPKSPRSTERDLEFQGEVACWRQRVGCD